MYNYTQFCVARLTDKTNETAWYRCPAEEMRWKENCKVADWGKMALGVLEWGEYALLRQEGVLAYDHRCARITQGTPCAGGGYGRDENNKCMGNHWALCLGDASKGDCLYMAPEDDCTSTRSRLPPCCGTDSCFSHGSYPLGQWPQLIKGADLPSKVTVWFHVEPAVAADRQG